MFYCSIFQHLFKFIPRYRFEKLLITYKDVIRKFCIFQHPTADVYHVSRKCCENTLSHCFMSAAFVRPVRKVRQLQSFFRTSGFSSFSFQRFDYKFRNIAAQLRADTHQTVFGRITLG